MTGTMVIVGASRGIGAAMAQHYASRTDRLISVSRTPAAHGHWVACDVADPSQVRRLADVLREDVVDALLFLGGTWEEGAFTDAYTFEGSGDDEIERVLAVNLRAPILLVRALLPNLRRSDNARVILIGSLSALDNTATKEVANSASKYGLRGAAQAMTRALRGSRIAFTVINPGNVATFEVLDDIEAERFDEQTPIPMSDLATAIDCALAMSPASVVAEINLAQRKPGPTA